MVLFVAGCVWLGMAVLFVLGLMCVARRPMPRAPALRRRVPAPDAAFEEPAPAHEQASVTQPALDI